MITIKELTPIFQMVFDDDSIVLTNQTSSNDVEGWDSMSHVNLILAIENKFKIRFNQKELLLMQNVGDLLHAIISKF
jgi:acyl carrier protein